VDDDAEARRRREGCITMAVAGAAVLIGLLFSHGSDDTTRPPGGSPCSVTGGALRCSPEAPGATYLPSAQDGRTLLPSYPPPHLPTLAPLPTRLSYPPIPRVSLQPLGI
jgi:hypothetical protein